MGPNLSWLLRMAWRDSRRNRARMLLFVSSIVAGIAAITAVRSFSENLKKDINREAKTLLGADLLAEGNTPLPDSTSLKINALSEKRSVVQNLINMAYFPKNAGTRLALVRAVEPGFPFFGTVKTEPATAFPSFQDGRNALVDHSLMLQFDLKIGDSVKIGDLVFKIEGDLISSPGRAGFAGSIAPAVWIPARFIDSTNLVQKGSRLWYQNYWMLPPGTQLPDIQLKSLKKEVETAKLQFESVESRKESVGDAFGVFGTFLDLVGFVSLLLGCIGVAGAVSIYIKDKLPTVAILRCLGASGRKAFYIYLIQILGIGLVGALAGAALGSLVQKLLPWVLKDFLPIANVSTDFTPKAFFEGTATGLAVAVLFALLPLSGILHTSPLGTLRSSFGEKTRVNLWLQIGVAVLIGLFLFGFTWLQIRSVRQTAFFMGGIAGAFALLWAMARGLMFLLRRFFPRGWSFTARQAVANLFRPDNQTVMLVVTIGLGTLLLSTLFLIQQLLLSQVSFSGAGKQPNLLLFDIQNDQKEGVAAMLKDNGLPIIQDVPIISMRLDAIDGHTRADDLALADSTKRMPGWVFDKEYRMTYRDTLIETEQLLEGEFPGPKAAPGEPIKVSVSEGYAETARLKLGSKLLWNVSGVAMETEVASIRKVDFNRVQTNFLVLFPNGYLESAPQFRVLVSRAPTPVQSAKIQGLVVEKFPNVSAIDLTQILRSVEEILRKVSFVIRFMALFSILTGLLVLLSSLYLSKFQRVKESVLLRTLGASRRHILWINGLEYFFLGSLACLAGAGLSVGAAFALAKFSFKIPFALNWLPLVLTTGGIVALTVIIGLFNSFEVVRKPPLEVLRAEIN